MVGFPLLLIPLAICNIIVFLMPGLSFSATLYALPLMSGVVWPVTLSDALLSLGILMLLLEVIKGARPGAKYVTDHLLSLVVFGAAAAEFLLLPQFATSTYFLLTALALVDFLSGIALRVRRAHLTPVAGSTATSSASAKVSAKQASAKPSSAEAAEPRFDAAPASAPATPQVEPAAKAPPPVGRDVADADSVAEQPAPSDVPSPQVQSPGLQPGNGNHPIPDSPPR